MTNSNLNYTTIELLSAGERVESKSAALKKELGIRDLALAQILIIVGGGSVGTAAKLGPSNLVFWLAGILLFYIPLAAVVTYLNRLMPLEGGLYQWARLAFNEFTGFMVAWNAWLFIIVFMSSLGLTVSSGLAYATGSSGAWMAETKWFIALASLACVGGLVAMTTVGLGVGKWAHNAGGVILIAAFAALVALPFLNLARGSISEYPALDVVMPELSLLNLTIFMKISVYALAGFEALAILAGECRNPARSIGRSVAIAAPVIALMYILGTASVLAFLSPEDVDLVNPIAQVFQTGARTFGIAATVAPLIIMLLLFRDLAQASQVFTTNSRLPMVAGWDRLLPGWFTRLHSKHKTPVNSILFAGAITLAIGLAGIAGADRQEAFQLLQSASGPLFASTYLVMFAIPLAGLKVRETRPPLWLKVASASGFIITLMFLTLSIFPIIEVENWLAFAAKISITVIIANAVGASIFIIAKKKRAQ